MSLDRVDDIQTTALGLLCRSAVNGELKDLLGQDAIVRTFGAPLPLPMMGQNILPCLSVYRLRDIDQDKGDFIYQDLTTWRFDYYTPATPLNLIDKRWPVMRRVWNIMFGAVRVGRSPHQVDEQPLPELQNVLRYVLGSGRVNYGTASLENVVYPSFRGEVTFEVDSKSPQAFYDDMDKMLRLDDFETLAVDWNLAETGADIEAQSWISLDQD
jgi:hypothetical protein